MENKKKNRRTQASEVSIPAGVYPELDRDLGRDKVDSVLPPMNWGGPMPGMPGTWSPTGIYPMFDGDLFRDNLENDLPAADWDDLWSDPRFR